MNNRVGRANIAKFTSSMRVHLLSTGAGIALLACASPAFADCSPDPAQPYDSVQCSGQDADGIVIDQNGVTVGVASDAEVASIDTGNADRDEHLRSPDFFDVAKFPKLEFRSTGITKTSAGYAIRGDLTIHGVTRPVTLDATLSEALTNPWGKQVRAARVMGKIKRQDFGLTWNKTLDQGGMLVGDEVAIDVKLELNK